MVKILIHTGIYRWMFAEICRPCETGGEAKELVRRAVP